MNLMIINHQQECRIEKNIQIHTIQLFLLKIGKEREHNIHSLKIYSIQPKTKNYFQEKRKKMKLAVFIKAWQIIKAQAQVL